MFKAVAEVAYLKLGEMGYWLVISGLQFLESTFESVELSVSVRLRFKGCRVLGLRVLEVWVSRF